MNNKIVFVTGISRGIGKAICELLVQEGYTVYGTYNTGKEEALELKKKLRNVELFQVDFSQREQTLALIKKLQKTNLFGVVNNAGMIEFEDFENYDMTIWDKTIEVNLNTTLLISVELGKSLQPGGSIVNISSADGFIGSFSSMAYSASKAAINNLTKSLANNYGKRGIRVNAVTPGWINTGMATDSSMEAAKISPLGRNGKPEEVAHLVSFLLSEKSSFITGSIITIDGGYTCVDYVMKLEAESFQTTGQA